MKEMCSALGLDDSGKEKAELVERIVGHSGRRQAADARNEPQPEQPAPKRIQAQPQLSTIPTTEDPMTAPTATAAPSIESILDTLPRPRLLDLFRLFGADMRDPSTSKDCLVKKLTSELRGGMPALLKELGRDELRAACRRHGLSDQARARVELQATLFEAAGIDPKAATVRPAAPHPDDLPLPGKVVVARHRQWLVEGVVLGESGESPMVRLVCLDDDDRGRALDVLWDLELGARVVEPETHGLSDGARLDPPSHFGAYLHALKWSAVSAADPNRFQAPFRAGIKLMAHQLAPLMTEPELQILHRVVSMYIDFAELQALERKQMTMRDWVDKLDEFPRVSLRALLEHAGKLSADEAREKAEREYARYRAEQDRLPRAIDAEFEKVAKQLQRPAPPRATKRGKK